MDDVLAGLPLAPRIDPVERTLPAVPTMRGLPEQAAEPSRGRLRGLLPLDVVTFTARCPSCGLDAEWIEEREDTRLRATVCCDCPDA